MYNLHGLPHVGSEQDRAGIRVLNQGDASAYDLPVFELRGPSSSLSNEEDHLSDVASATSSMESLYPQAMFEAHAEVYWKKGAGPWRNGNITVQDNVVYIDYGTESVDILSWLDYDEFQDLVRDVAERFVKEWELPGVFVVGKGVLIDRDELRLAQLKDPEDVVWEDVLEYAVNDLQDRGLVCKDSGQYVVCTGTVDGYALRIDIRK